VSTSGLRHSKVLRRSRKFCTNKKEFWIGIRHEKISKSCSTRTDRDDERKKRSRRGIVITHTLIEFCDMFRSAVLFLLVVSAGAFNTKPQAARAPAKLYGNAKTAPKSISYGEASRPYRRTVYSHDDWVKHRSPDRFFRNILSITTSGVYKNISRLVMTPTAVAIFVVLWNMLTGGYTDLRGVAHGAVLSGRFMSTFALPLAPFDLASPSLGLLLGKSSLVDTSFCPRHNIISFYSAF
jgi:hypothetical protein